VSLAHGLAHVPSLRGYAFSSDGRRLARLAKRDGGLAVETLAVGGSGAAQRVHWDDTLLTPARI